MEKGHDPSTFLVVHARRIWCNQHLRVRDKLEYDVHSDRYFRTHHHLNSILHHYTRISAILDPLVPRGSLYEPCDLVCRIGTGESLA